MTSLKDIGEDRLVERLLRLVPVAGAAEGPGDDCAVVEPPDGGETLQLLKTDAIVCGIHFLQDTPPERVGWKAAARVVSDFAAMGGKPDRFLITLAIPASTPLAWLEGLYHGIGNCLRAHQALLVGGETTRLPEGSATVISIAATGLVRREQLTLRSGGTPGDTLLVTGRLGGSITGKHLDFQPRLTQAAWLTTHFPPKAMMDISDGLAKDLPRLAQASGCGFRIDKRRIPANDGCSTAQALGDGEDYELLMATEPAKVEPLLAAWAGSFPDLPLTMIGELCAPGTGDALDGGWDHFAEA